MLLTLVLGGARSGKSAFAERLAAKFGDEVTYVATAQAFDEEMRERITLHRTQRPASWKTLEAPLALPETLGEARLGGGVVLVDCLTLWLSNLMLAERDPEPATAHLLEALRGPGGDVICVSNEVGLGIVPDNALARRFRDAQGRLNQAIAAEADRVVLMAAGLPLELKERRE